MASFSIKVPD